MRRAVAAPGVDRVERVRGQRHAVVAPKQRDQPGRVTGKVHDLEPGHLLALAKRAGDPDGTPIPEPRVHQLLVNEASRLLQPGEITPISPATRALRVSDLGGMA